MKSIDIKKIVEHYQPDSYFFTEDDDFIMIVKLMYHVSVYVNPDPFMNFEDRYCFYNIYLALKAIKEYNKTGIMRYWQKHWNKNISIAKNYAYRSGEHQIIKNALYQVDWNIDELKSKYKYKN